MISVKKWSKSVADVNISQRMWLMRLCWCCVYLSRRTHTPELIIMKCLIVMPDSLVDYNGWSESSTQVKEFRQLSMWKCSHCRIRQHESCLNRSKILSLSSFVSFSPTHRTLPPRLDHFSPIQSASQEFFAFFSFFLWINTTQHAHKVKGRKKREFVWFRGWIGEPIWAFEA